MSRFPIDIPKSKQTEKLVIKEWLIVKLSEYFIYSMFVLALPFMAIMKLNSDLNKSEPIGFSICFLVLSLILSGLMIYSIFDLNTLKRISGHSRNKNSYLINKIAEKNNWSIQSTNQQMTIINLSRQEFGSYGGKQMTILYDDKDILANCISFGVGSSPSPFHWFANKRKVSKLKTEFENGIKNVLQHSV